MTERTQTSDELDGWLSAYRTGPDGYDEMVDAAGEPRAHWRPLIDHLRGIDAEELNRRSMQARRLIHENGVTYNVHDESRGGERPWKLDTLPVLVTPDHWRTLDAGLAQRARLLERVIEDIYGPQRLLREGLLPPQLVFANPSFLRACHGIRPPGDRWMHIYCADVGRGPDGSFVVLSDRTQAPSGVGYALENRIVLSRTLPEAFRDFQVHRLALFFRTLRETLAGLAAHHRDNPHIVLLTPGPASETYFEHAYLARYLGYTLVEGGDLTVRDDKVFLKTLGGLNQVDVILRRMDDDCCDPLELRGDSANGVTGLTQAARAGNVAVANALGTGAAECPALLPLLPALCRRLLDEDLKLPSARTWWCGEPADLAHVVDRLGDLVVKPAFNAMGMDPVFAAGLSAGQRRDLADRLRARPADYVAQERVALSTVPAWNGQGLEPRHMVQRLCLVAAGDRDYRAMPGGLARISPASHSVVVSMQHGGGSKDTWVLSDQPVSNFSLLAPPGADLTLTRGGRDLPSRVADDLFWLGRYVERTDGVVRLLRGILVRMTEQSTPADVSELPALLKTLTHMTESYPGFLGPESDSLFANPQPELRAMIFDHTRAGSVRSTLAALRRVAGMARDRLSPDTWRVLFNIDQDFAALPRDGARRGKADGAGLTEALAMLNRSILSLSAFNGLSAESMTRGLGWTFMDMGRRIERVIQASCLLRSMLVRPARDESPALEAVLEVADSIMTYRRRYYAGLRAPGVIDLLLTDETNPRSVAFQFVALAEHVAHLPGDRSMPARSPDQRIVISLLAALRLGDIDRLSRLDAQGSRTELDELLDRLYIETPAISEFISHAYLSHTDTSRQMVTLGEIEGRRGGNAL